MIFYGTETGTAEKLANAFSREAKAVYGLDGIVADLDDFDYEDLSSLGPDTIVVLLLASAGEGEPTQNVVRFARYLHGIVSSQKHLGFHYAAFGLGSSSYRMFNQAIIVTDEALGQAGAHRLGELGRGDDRSGTLGDDSFVWRGETLRRIADSHGLKRRPWAYEPTLNVAERGLEGQEPVLDGEPNKAQLYGKIKGPFGAKNPFPAPIKAHGRLTSKSSERQCTHIEIDTSRSTLAYVTEDHVAIQPSNPISEVDRFLDIFGLAPKADTIIDFKSNDLFVSAPVPGLTTYKSPVAKYLNICGPVSRPFLAILSNFTSNEEARAVVSALAQDSALFNL